MFASLASRITAVRRITLFAFSLFAALTPARAHAQRQQSDPVKTTSSAWVIGDKSPQDGSILEAWFDRRVPPTTQPNHEVTVGSPSDIAVWLRTDSQSCRETESKARKVTDATDGPLLYVCTRLRNTGDFRLVAENGAPELIVSDSIKVAQSNLVSPSVSAAITTIVGFLAGLLTSYVQGLIQLKREDVSTQKAVEKTLAQILSREILDNQNELQSLIGGGTPVLLKTAAYNNAEALGPIAWGYLGSPAAASYRRNIDDLYKKHIPAYQAAVRTWNVASPQDKPAALVQVQAAATLLVKKLREFKE
jgi:hypothetical protein